ncbi:MAG: 16S rRNA (guanine(527)-N(7))-methyltransferase RsmG [Spirochaetales bacterium]|nr:16S rRNA (guanine(527)-N(7))-methyltransferase RsmG [Spirochaetales bacterium]
MKPKDPAAILKNGFTNLGLSWTQPLLDKFSLYSAELIRWNKRFGFINTDDPAELAIHMLDALSGLPVLHSYQTPSPILDIGSGAGLPGLPLAFCLPDTTFFLCERKAKEAAFLRNIVLLTNTSNVTVLEDLREIPASAGCAVFRAVKTIDELLPILSPVLRDDGIIFAYKATLARIEEEKTVLEKKYSHIYVHKLVHPDASRKRHAVVLKQQDRIRG